jgi:glycosyltransferase involved in cell wall biosynthesis
VVMPVYNGLAHLDESIGSILSQSFERFELLILDDGSTDGTLQRLREWEAMDSRVTVFVSTENLGVVASSNLVTSKAATALIARMDADDVSHPDRLRRQWEIFQAHPEVQIVGTLWDGVDGSGRTVRPRDRWRLAYPSRLAPFAHGSVMFRADSFHKLGGYRAECRYWEDLDLYFRMQALGRVVAIPETLYHYRFHTRSTRAATPPEQLIDSIALMRECRQARAEGRDYEEILRSHVPVGGERVPPAVLNSITSARLWAGHSPDTIRLLLSRGELSWDRSTVTAVAMTVWGTLSPPSLRFFLRRLIQLRDLLAGRWVRGKDVLDWRLH